jgi:hypothetical protein
MLKRRIVAVGGIAAAFLDNDRKSGITPERFYCVGTDPLWTFQ